MKNKYPFFAFVFMAALGILLVACGKDEGTEVTPTPTPISPTEPTIDLMDVRGKIANNVAFNLIIPAYENLAKNTADLVTKVAEFNTSPTVTTLTDAQTALKTSWTAWQSAGIYMFGPAEDVALRKSLNTYPTDIAQIDANIQSGQYILGSLDNQAAVGFPAIDYLLNGTGADNAAIISDFENASGSQQYLTDLATDLNNRVNSSLNGWLSTGENFTATFTETDALGIDVGSSLGLIVNSIDLHFQRFTRDGKVGIPAGVRSAGVPRPKAVEALYGGYSVELLKESMDAHKHLFMGTGENDTDEDGLYDYLVAIDAKDLADDMKAQFEVTRTAIDGLSDPLGEQIESDTEKVTNVFIEMQKLVVFFKADMASMMGISITNQDGDGD